MSDKKVPTPKVTRRKFVKTGTVLTAGAVAAPAILRSSLAYAAGRPVKLGYVSPRTGPLAPFAEADDFVINGVRSHLKDGVKIGNQVHPVEIIVKDTQSNPNRGAEVSADLILKDEVDIIMGAGTPETTNPLSDQAEINEVPCITSDAPWQPYFFGRGGNPAKGFDWTYHFFWGLEDVIGVFLNLWNSIPSNKTVGALWPNDSDGNAWGDPKLGFPGPLKAADWPNRMRVSETPGTPSSMPGVAAVPAVVPVAGGVSSDSVHADPSASAISATARESGSAWSRAARSDLIGDNLPGR